MKLLDESTRADTEPAEPTDTERDDSKSRLVMALQGATVFVVMFVALWWLLSRDDQQSE